MKTELKNSIINYSLNTAILLLAGLSFYLIFSLVSNSIKSKGKDKEMQDTTASKITNQPNLSIQIEIQNGSGENRVGAIFRDYLKKKGYDVVELGNYKSNDVDKSMIIDRSGDARKSQRIAEVLGISGKNITQQISRELYLDATIIIGKDFNELKPYTDKATLK